ncbi:MAG: GDP-mannose 4,6-dehydratase [Hyphomonas sp.]|uniref:GDP-mannose 4,6-dehydratase n=1 Tax=Hyphomonas sp. TaxID=87 RepID=UPI003265E549
MLSSSSRRILITGANGFVGRYVIESLVAAGYGIDNIVCLVHNASQNDDAPGLSVTGDISNREQVFGLIESIRPAAVIHLAAVALPAEARRDTQTAWRTNVDGTIALADALLRHAPSARLVFAGSAEVYGQSFNTCPLPIQEDAPLRPMTTYGASKAAAEIAIMQKARQGLNAICFRAFNHTGPGQPADYVIPSFARQVASIEADQTDPVLKVGNLDAYRDFLDVRDVANAYVRAIAEDVDTGPEPVFNISSGTSRRIGEILDALIARSKVDIRTEIDPGRLRPSEVERAAGDNKRAATRLDWEPAVPFDDTLQAVLEFWRERV